MNSLRSTFLGLGTLGRTALTATAMGASIGLAHLVPGVGVVLTLIAIALMVAILVKLFRRDTPGPMFNILFALWAVAQVGSHWAVSTLDPLFWWALFLTQVLIGFLHGGTALGHLQKRLATPETPR